MIDAYYSIGCDSRELFSPFEIAKDPDFEKYLNKYNVLHFDVAEYLNDLHGAKGTLDRMDASLLVDFRREFPDVVNEKADSAPSTMIYTGS